MNSKNNVIIGLSGRKLKIPKKWKNPSGKWHLGLKSLFKPTMSKVATDITQKLSELDCIVWHDGSKWCACIETFNGNNLKKAKVLTNFRDEHEYGILCLEGLKMTYCVTIHENGNLLEIFMPYDHHGSVVAQIAAAHFPANPECSGLAPGAQLIFMCVMAPTDQYALNLEALKKALLKCIEMKVDIVNYSILSFEGDADIAKIIREMVNLHNILIFKCVGNRGPFYLTTYKCDKNVENVIFTIGAVLTKEMKKRIYNLEAEDNCPVVIYDFSSRGPGAMSSRGLDFVAPGAAITDKPRFHPEQNGGYAGTSYSCPNAAGAVACLLSGLKVNKIEYSPKSIRFVLSKTAKKLENQNKFVFGHGLIQISDAFIYYCENNDIDFDIKIPTPIAEAGGIYFEQNADEDDASMEREIDLSQFIEIKPSEAIAEKWTLEVSPETAEAFIELPSQIDENNKFKIKASTKNLEAGSLNFAEISVIDPVIGSIYSIPVNVLRILNISETCNENFQKEITLNYENPHHLIFHTRFESNKKCDIKITAMEATTTALNVQYLIQDYIDMEHSNLKTFNFTEKDNRETYSMPIIKKTTYEICFYQEIGASPTATYFLEFDFKDDLEKTIGEKIQTAENEKSLS